MKLEQNKTYKLTLKLVRINIVIVKKQYILNIMCVSVLLP